MPRGRLWTRAEDEAIRKAVAGNRTDGISAQWADFRNGQRYANRLARLAKAIGRTQAAVWKRAQRIGAESYLMRAKIPERARARAEREAEAPAASANQPEPEPDADAREVRRIMAQIRRVTG